jgi:hypothetical protein
MLYRNNSEKLAMKIREQATAIIHLNSEKDKLEQDADLYQQQIKKLSQEIENTAFDKEKIKVILFKNLKLKLNKFLLKALQNHLNQQQTLLHQLQNRLKEYE